MSKEIEIIDVFSDLLEGKRSLALCTSAGMIHFQLSGGRPITADTFRLDSEEVDSFIAALNAARARVRPAKEGVVR